MKKFVCLVFIAAILEIGYCSGFYNGYKLLRLSPSIKNKNVIDDFIKAGLLDVWRARTDGTLDVLVGPRVIHKLQNLKIQSQLLLHDIDQLIENQKERGGNEGNRASSRHNVTFDQYNTIDEINEFLDETAAQYPGITELGIIGSSWEGRQIKFLRIGNELTNPTKPIFFLDAGVHAREWIAPATATYVISQLVADTTGLLDLATWIIVPSWNPDGYEFTWTNDRLWRKTRSDRGDACKGVDGNRNFDFHWMEIGASDLPCSETYAGPQPFSEPECQAIANYVNANGANIQVYITLHSYSQLFMYPYGYTDVPPTDWQELERVAALATSAMQAVHGTVYQYGQVSQILYFNSGSSRDYVKGVTGVPYVYTIELPDEGTFGFLLPPQYILPTGEETYAGLVAVANDVFGAKIKK